MTVPCPTAPLLPARAPAHCHFTYELPSGYRSFGWWPTPADALHAAAVHDPSADNGAQLISEHAPSCACPNVEGSSA